jgi:hypothetical protein
MCIICLDLEKGLLAPWEAKRNLREMVEKIGQEHAIAVEKKISEAIFNEINLNYGETLVEDQEYCHFCECVPCDCGWGEE